MMKAIFISAGTIGLGAIALASGVAQAERAVPIPAAAHDVPKSGGMQTAVLAGGCFWGMEAVFEHVKGVKAVTNGYAGGTAGTGDVRPGEHGTHRPCRSGEDHLRSRPGSSYATLLRVYFSVAHNPTELNRQGPDSGPSYRSAIFPQSPVQKKVAAAYIAQLGKAHVFTKPIVTKLESGTFYAAEAYHQDFFDRNPSHPYIVRFDKPKVAAFKAGFPAIAR